MKPNYALIKIKGSRELVTVIKRLLKYEKIKDLAGVHYQTGKKHFDVALLTEDRIIIVRNPAGSKKAHMKEFDRDLWDQYTAGQEQADIKGYIQHYHETVQALGEVWI